MADVDLIKRAIGDTVVKPPPKPKTSNSAGLTSPSPASAPLNVLPLAAGQVVKGDKKQPSLTPHELAQLKQTGWTEGEPIPDNVEMARRVAIAQSEIPISPVDPNTPALNVETVDITQLDPEKQAKIMEIMKETMAPHAETTAPPPDQRSTSLADVLSAPSASEAKQIADAPSVASQAIPGWKPPGQPSYQPAVPTPQSQAVSSVPRAAQSQAQIDIDMPTANQAMTNTATPKMAMPGQPVPASTQSSATEADVANVAEPHPATSTEVEQPSPETEPPPSEAAGPSQPSTTLDTGLDKVLQDCPNCGFNLSMPAIPEPGRQEKQAFLQSILGQKAFIKDYILMGGAVRVVFRTLPTTEIDIIYKQVHYEREKGLIPTVEDYWEKLNRYRVYLQTLKIEAGMNGPDGFSHDLPAGYTKETSPHAESHWNFEVQDRRQTGLPLIETYFVTEVFKTEVFQRAVTHQCAKFNRLVARLEALIDNSDFWTKTEEPS